MKKDKDGNTYLHYAAKEGDIAIFMNLLPNDDVNVQNNEGNTPLHMAYLHSRHEVGAALIRAGADTKIRNNEGKTPLDIPIGI